MNKIMALSHVFVFVGVVLVLASVITIPHTTTECFTVEKSEIWADETFTLQPNNTRIFEADLAAVNTSIINIHVETSDDVVLKIAERLYAEPVFEWIIKNTPMFPVDELFWTYPRRGNIWFFIFENQQTMEVTVLAKIAEYFPRASEWGEVTHYNQVLSPVFAYPGIIMIIVGTILKPRKTIQ